MKSLLPLTVLTVALLACTPAPEANIALHRTATASSSYDFNLTAQLVTDGILFDGVPAFLEVISSDGPVNRVERENALDGDLNSRNIVTGTEGWLEWRFHGYKVEADVAEVLYQEALKGGRGGPEHNATVPVQAGSDGAIRLCLTFPHEGRWRVKNVAFYHDGKLLEGILPAEHFTSAWISEESEDEWLMLDLGIVRKVNSVQPHWIYKPDSFSVEVSKDGESWKAFSPGRWRYVRLSMHNDKAARICMTELDVLGPDLPLKDDGGWKIQRASEISAGGADISLPGFLTEGWLPASVPATVLANYIAAGAVPDPGYGDNWSQISDSYFNSDFWYRKEFEWHRGSGRPVLEFDGINWKADVWLNGRQAGRIEGAFTRGRFDVDSLLHDGLNVLAVKTERNAHPGAVKEKTAKWTGYNGGVLGADNPTFHASIGWDWMTTVRGRNCGIWNDVRLIEKGQVTVSDPLVVSKVNPDGSSSITPSVIVKGIGATAGKVTLEGWIGELRFSKELTTDGEISFAPADFPQLKDCRLDLWWPVGYGAPALHDAGFAVSIDGVPSDSLHFKAGIREMGWDSAGGSLKLFINGRRFVPQGGNWGFSEHNLVFPAEKYDIALDYHRQMNINMIRNWVGQIGDEEFYDACDRYGVTVWQDFWLANPSDGPDPDDESMFLANADDWVRRIRRHPCLALYCGRNEGDPPATLDRALRDDIVARLHPGMLYISNSADGIVSGHGPYNAIPFADYWSKQSGKLHSERGLPNAPTWESLQRMLPPQDRWPIGELWGKHDFTTDGAQSVKTYERLLDVAWGRPASAQEHCFLSQWLNYEGCRAIYESSNSSGRNGMILWMTHPSWPSMVFCTYDYYFEPTGAFFGCKKACEPLHIQYNLSTKEVEVVNICGGDLEGLTARLDIYDASGEALAQRSATVSSPDDSTISCFAADLPVGEPALLLKLRLQSAEGELLSENFYMIPEERSGSLKALRTLRAAKLSQKQSAGGKEVSVKLRNDDTVPALLVRLVLKDRNGNEILPASYSDNYFALLAGEEKNVCISSRTTLDRPVIEIQQLGDFAPRPEDYAAALSADQCLILGGSVAPGSMPQTFENGQLVCSDLKR
ncbi:MAG: beta-glycosidase, partial [Bacteroidales bacterium]|nr:beta-glycosidase [Bacteroidales bacterium]